VNEEAKHRSITVAALSAIFLANVWLNLPLFVPGELPFPGTIERGYVGMARFVSQHPNPWGWNPFPYCGLPTQFMYVPVLPYFAGMWMRLLPNASPDTVYRIIVSLATCLGPVTLFLFALRFMGSRRWAFLAAMAYSFISPSYALFPAVEMDRGIVQLPWRVQVLAKYGEGPHNTVLTLLPIALLLLWTAIKGRGYPRILAAAIVLAALPLINWLGAMGAALSCSLLLVAALSEPEVKFTRAAAAIGLAYLLACFWLTPSFVKTIFFNWPVDSFAYKLGNKQVWLLAGMCVGALTIRVAFRLLRGSFYFCLVTMAAFVFGWISTVWYVYGIDTIPESRRYAIEFELFVALALAEAARLAMQSKNGTVRLCVYGSGAVMLLVGAPQLAAYVSQGWRVWWPAPAETTLEYQVGKRLAERHPEGRVFVSGGVRFRLNSWFDLQQVGGAFETGLTNRVPVELAYRIRTAETNAADMLMFLKVMGTEYVAAHGEKSTEYYRDFRRPDRLDSIPVVYKSGDDAIHELRRRPLAHLVTETELPAQDVLEHPSSMERFVAAIEDASRPVLKVEWPDVSKLWITGPVRPGDLVAVQVNAADGWKAFQEGREIPWTADRMGFLVLHASPSVKTRIEVNYEGTTEQRAMAVICAAAWTAAIGVWLGLRRKSGLRHSGVRQELQTAGG
jgi:hypothetical protein